MRSILSRGNRAILESFACSNMLLALDYDGTLAPIVPDPASASMRPTTTRLLQAATRLYPVVVISGRARADALQRLKAVGVHEVIGNHGIESRRTRDPVGGEVQRWIAVLERRLAAWKGVEIEPKRHSVAVHYRRSRTKKGARAAILEAAAVLAGARVVGGKLVVNLVPMGSPHKGVALERERERLRCDTALYVGDDDTDEDVFTLDQPGRLLSVRVGRKKASAASYCIPGQTHIDQLLGALVELRWEAAFRKVATR